MRTLKVCSYVFLSGAMLLLVGCKSKQPPEGAPQTANVTINACVAVPADVTVHETGTVDWQPDVDYTIRFKTSGGPIPNPIHVIHGSHNPHPIQGHSGCDPLGHGEFYCKYSLTKDNEMSTCADPGVHIVP
jgi:hypothetical protein